MSARSQGSGGDSLTSLLALAVSIVSSRGICTVALSGTGISAAAPLVVPSSTSSACTSATATLAAARGLSRRSRLGLRGWSRGGRWAGGLICRCMKRDRGMKSTSSTADRVNGYKGGRECASAREMGLERKRKGRTVEEGERVSCGHRHFDGALFVGRRLERAVEEDEGSGVHEARRLEERERERASEEAGGRGLCSERERVRLLSALSCDTGRRLSALWIRTPATRRPGVSSATPPPAVQFLASSQPYKASRRTRGSPTQNHRCVAPLSSSPSSLLTSLPQPSKASRR